MNDKKIQPSTIRKIILDILKNTPDLQFVNLEKVTKSRVEELGFSPLTNPDELIINEIIWDLFVERIITLGSRSGSEARYPFISVTKFGENYINNTEPHYFDPDEYIAAIKINIPDLDEIILQYLLEAMTSFRRQLWFGSAVLLGAASERMVLLLLESIKDWEINKNKKEKINSLLSRPSLPAIFEIINNTLMNLINKKAIPYKTHEGVMIHLLSLYEMIRVQRNDAVHPTMAEVDRNRIYLSLQSFPTALQVTDNVRKWFLDNINEQNV